jgi:hypothetical protein
MAVNERPLRAIYMYEFGKCLYGGKGLLVCSNLVLVGSFVMLRSLMHCVCLISWDSWNLVEGAKFAWIAARLGNLAGMFLYVKCLRDGIGVRHYSNRLMWVFPILGLFSILREYGLGSARGKY